jgi:N-formylglutamate amidohydrolase
MSSADGLNRQTSLSHKSYDTYYGLEPIILNFPHSGRIYPERHLKFINNSKKSLRIFEDPYLDIILPDITRCNTSYLINHCARAFIDVNRTLHQQSSTPMINGEAMGLIPMAFPCGDPLYQHVLNQHDIETRIKNYYQPYHIELESLIRYNKQKFKDIVLLDCHSMPSHGDKSDPDAFKARPDIIIGDNFGTSASQKIVDIIAQGFIGLGLSVFNNFPYAGGYIINNYSNVKNGIHTIQIEINRRLYVTDTTFELTDNAKNITEKFHIVLQKLKQSLI